MTERHYSTEYRCCPGYSQSEGSPGCPKELYTSNKNITKVAESLRLNKFVRLFKASGLSSELDHGSRYTVFAPSDKAFSALPPETLDELENDKDLLRDTLKLHIATGKIVTEAMKDHSKISSLDGSEELWINVVDDGETIVVQGGEIVLPNKGASNGIIHVIDRVLEPTAGSIKEILKSDPNFSIFSQMIENSAMEFTNITLFAPTDQAFEVMDRERLERLISNEDCVERFVKYHMLPKPLYSAAMDNGRFTTVEGHIIDVKVNGDGNITVNDAQVTNSDVTGTNGIVHTINKVLMPVSAMNLVEVAKVLNLTTLVDYLNKSGLSATLNGEQGPFTLFAPSNKAFEDLPESVKRSLRDNPARLREILSYHVIPERKWTYEFGKDNLVNSVNEPNKLRLNSFRYGKVHAVNGACITKANIEACNGVINVIHKVLLPPTKTVYDFINTDPRFVTLMEASNSTKLGRILRDPSASLTLFAPTDWAFAKLEINSPGTMESLLVNPDELTEVLEHHVVNGTLYTCGIHCMYSYWSLFSNHFSVYSLSRGVLRMRYDWRGRVFVNGMRIADRDLLATNGVIHVIDDVLELYPQGRRTSRFRAHSVRHGKTGRFH